MHLLQSPKLYQHILKKMTIIVIGHPDTQNLNSKRLSPFESLLLRDINF